MKIDVSDEFLDELVVSSLRESISMLKDEIKRLKNKKRLADYEKEDLADSILHLDGLQKAYAYYGGK